MIKYPPNSFGSYVCFINYSSFIFSKWQLIDLTMIGISPKYTLKLSIFPSMSLDISAKRGAVYVLLANLHYWGYIYWTKAVGSLWRYGLPIRSCVKEICMDLKLRLICLVASYGTISFSWSSIGTKWVSTFSSPFSEI